MKKIAFIIHQKAKERNALQQKIQNLFSEDKISIDITQYQAHSTVLAQSAIQKGFEYIVCAGGDGSINETVNGILQAKKELSKEAQDKIRLAVLPLGTGNDFIKTIQSPSDIEGLKKSIEQDKNRLIDLGLATFNNSKGERQQRWFINITDIGMGGIVVEKLSRYSKWLGANLTYQRAIASTLLTFKPVAIQARADDYVFEGKVMNFVVANGKYFGSGLGIAPSADPSDGQLSIVILGDISIFDYIQNLGKIKACTPINHPRLIYRKAKNISVQSIQKLPIDMDGEFIGYSPLEINLIEKALNVIV